MASGDRTPRWALPPFSGSVLHCSNCMQAMFAPWLGLEWQQPHGREQFLLLLGGRLLRPGAHALASSEVPGSGFLEEADWSIGSIAGVLMTLVTHASNSQDMAGRR